MVSAPAEFLQKSSGFMMAHDPRKPLLDLLSKYGKRSTAGRFIMNMLSQSKNEDKKVGAFASLKSEIQSLISTLNTQQDEDLTTLNWCQKKDDALNSEIDDLTEEVNNLKTKIGGHEKKRDRFKAKTAEAQQAVKDAHEDLDKRMKQNVQDKKDNKEDFRTMNADLSLLRQAYAQLEQAFQGVKGTGGAGVLDTVDSLIRTYVQSIEENKNAASQLDDAQEDLKADHVDTVKREQNKVDRMAKGFKTQVGFVEKTTDKRFSTDSSLESVKNSYARIFTAAEGKCNDYRAKIEKRREDRGVEITNLHSALKALSEYMESIGIRMSF